MRAQLYLGVFREMPRQMRAHAAENLAIFLRGRVAHGVRQVDHVRARFRRRQRGFAQEIDIRAAGIFGRELHVFAVCRAEADHLRDLLQRFRRAKSAAYASGADPT